ncbi:MAG: DUF6318 family protein [Actinomyces sp.]|uniref:DUF6318 family protein n=1 Tax=Actinomyces sp. TaxID=29317 RepID=UPI0026DAFBA0|nr:DUF6318 family protein [Actinomyces sp.]MDO4242732.1 DUF6318 family protein [Actinomyces sp.]
MPSASRPPTRPVPTRLLATLSCLLVACALTSCSALSRGEASAAPSAWETWTPSPSASASATASPSPTYSDAYLSSSMRTKRHTALSTPKPEHPGGWGEEGMNGAVAAAIYFMSLYPYVYATGDLTDWEAMSDDACIFCNSVIADVRALHADGGWMDPWTQTVISVVYAPPADEQGIHRVDVTASAEASTAHDGRGKVTREYDAIDSQTIFLTLTMIDGQWIIHEGETP